MFLELIATVFAGIACAGIIMLVNRILGGRLPRWFTPVAAGLGMIGMTISNEYTWFERTAGSLPEGFEIAITVEEQSWLRPWTQAFPYTKRFIALDPGASMVAKDLPGQYLTDVYFFGRWSPVSRAPMLFDCTQNQTAVLIDGADFGEDGSLSNADWVSVLQDDPVLRTVCGA